VEFKPEQLLVDAIEAARHALRDLEPDQVPASMQRVVGYAGGKLPPPFARSLLAELETNEFLRSKALEVWKLERPPSGDRQLASYRFLERGDGWLMDLLGAGYSLGSKDSAVGDQTVEIERDAFQAEAASLKERLKAARKEQERLERELREVTRSSREPEREERENERRLEDQLEETARIHAAAVSELGGTLAGVRQELQAAREAARMDRQLRAEAEAAHRSAIAPEAQSVDPGVLAERLDAIAVLAAAAGPAPKVEDGGETPVQEQSLTDLGTVRPDSAEAIDWLIAAGPAGVLVDGYNVGFLLADKLDPVQARLLAEETVGRLRLVAREAEVLVVFDSEITDDEALPSPAGGAGTVFSGGRIADDAIVDLASTRANAVVITNDREVRERAEATGAVALWSDALVEWSRRR
jgi:hypothetical protein